MCNNAMVYNAPETAYYSLAKQLLSAGLQIISKVSSTQRCSIASLGMYSSLCLKCVGIGKVTIHQSLSCNDK